METIPFYIPVVFIAITAVTLFSLHKALQVQKTVLAVLLFWLGLQAALGLSGFYLVSDTIPPRFALTVLPPFVLIIGCLVTKKGRLFLASLDAKWLTLLHVVRIPVEVVLYWLFLQKYVPELMTFEGRNFDIFSGLTAPFVFYFGYIQKKMSRRVLLTWNFLCLALLVNIVVHAILSTPSSFQQFAFDQPNIGILYFPFIWLPCFVVPVVLFSHLAIIYQLVKAKQVKSTAVRQLSLSASH